MYNTCGSGGSGGSLYDQYDINAQGMNQNRVKLQVEDALSYLDQVKTQFADQPNVYTQFLDIMKDFKSQAIDTPGVITRVSRLFHGRSALIMGFNTFLPPGFEVQVVGSKITITEPSGNKQVILNNPEAERVSTEEKSPVEDVPQSSHQPLVEQTDESAQGTPTPAALAPSASTPLINSSSQDINEAISYVNRIKARFASKPIVYKKFLDILHSYQRTVDQQTRTPQREKAVLEAVTALFGEEPDLLEEFRHFLPGVCGMRGSSEGLWDSDTKEHETTTVSSESEEVDTRMEISDSETEQETTPRRKRRSKTRLSTEKPKTRAQALWKREVDVKDAALAATVDDIVYFDEGIKHTYWMGFDRYLEWNRTPTMELRLYQQLNKGFQVISRTRLTTPAVNSLE
ncbi:unnamed protein product [Heligmosomoides polygyrus]|uniref:HDAC_interact domain-containing protein n=1 Tax=Heligmosomoides polygyrus TaxID=6339 RepID=A0A3P8AYI7_HELPZ|nr:unnamed protein product [Heligmosomoides polygyrus]